MKQWNKKEIAIVKGYYGKIDTFLIAKKLNNRSIDAIRKKANQLKIVNEKVNCTNHKKWSEKEINFLKKNYGKMNTQALSLKLNRSIDSIKKKAGRLNIKFEKISRSKINKENIFNKKNSRKELI